MSKLTGLPGGVKRSDGSHAHDATLYKKPCFTLLGSTCVVTDLKNKSVR